MSNIADLYRAICHYMVKVGIVISAQSFILTFNIEEKRYRPLEK